MRGGVNAHDLFHTDIQDLEVLNTIVKENIEATKKSGQNML